MLQKITILALALGMSVMPTAQAQDKDVTANIEAETETEKLSLQSVIEHTYANNPQIKAARAELMATQEQLPQALSNWRPSLSADLSINSADIDGSNFGPGSGSTAKDGGLSFEQPIFRGGRTLAETKIAKKTILAQRALLNALEQNILLQTATAYVDILRDTAIVDLSQNDYSVLAQQLEATRDRFEFGELTKTDVSQAEARLAGAESAIITARGNLKISEAAFLKTVGLQPKNLDVPNAVLPIPETMDAAFAQAEHKNPRIISAIAAHESSESDVDNVFGELLPQVGLSGSWNRTFDPQPGLIDEQTTRTIGVGATIPLYQSGAVRSRIRAAKNTSNQRKMDIIEAKRLVRQNVTQSWENLQTAKGEIAARKAQVKAAAIAEQGVKKEAEFGSRTILDTLDAQQEHLDARVALIAAERNETVARFSLLEAIGVLTPQSLDLQAKSPDFDLHLRSIKHKFFDTDVDSVD